MRSVAAVAFVLALAAPALALPPQWSPDPASAAAALYGATARVAPAPGGAFAAAFPTLERYLVVVGDGGPEETHTMAWDGTHGFDATQHFDLLLAGSGAVVATAADAARYASAFAEVANAELQSSRDALPDATATPVLGGFEVTVRTWSAVNGVAATWSVSLRANAVKAAQWTVTDVFTGAYEPALDASWLPSGTSVTTTYPADGADVVRTEPGPRGPVVVPPRSEDGPWTDLVARPNFDGTTWIARWSGPVDDDTPADLLAVGSMLADAGVEAYALAVRKNVATTCPGAAENPAPNWGFEPADVDCQLPIFLARNACAACVSSSAVNGHYMEFNPGFVAYLRGLGYMTGASDRDVARAVLQHEYVHVLQRFLTNDIPGNDALIEGTARFSETIAYPALAADATSFWYGTPHAETSRLGSAYLLRHPSLGACGHSYSFAPFWGYLYAHDGGVATIRRAIDAAAVTSGSPPCPARLAAAVDAALSGAGGAHATFRDAFDGFSTALYARDLSWAPPFAGEARDWAEHLVPLKTEAFAAGTRTLPAWSAEYVALAPGDVVSATTAAQGEWAFRLLARSATGDLLVTPLVSGEPATVPVDGRTDVVLAAVRLATTAGGYALAAG